MKIKLSAHMMYDTEDKELWKEYVEYMDDHTLTMSSYKEFLIDRYVNPNFDKATVVTIELMP